MIKEKTIEVEKHKQQKQQKKQEIQAQQRITKKGIDKINNIKNILQKILNSPLFIILIGILIFVKSMLFYQNTIVKIEPIEIRTISATFSFVAVLMCFLCVLPNRARIIIAMVSNIFFSILLLGDDLYYTYSNNILSIAQISNLQYGEEIISTLPMLLNPSHIIYLLDIVLIISLFLTKVVTIEKKSKSTSKQKIAKIIIGAVGIIIFVTISVKYVEEGKERSYNKYLQIRESTIFGYHIYDIENTFNIKKQAAFKKKEDMLQEYNKLKEEYQENYGQIQYDFSGMAENKNVIMLQLESVQEFVVNKEIDGKEITPNLNKFLKENIEFSQMNMQSYASTADSEHSSITSIYPMENGMSFSKYYTNTYDDIFKIFKEGGYLTSYMHGNDGTFWNRANVYTRMPVDHIEFKPEFEDVSEIVSEYVSDELIYKQAVQKLKNYQRQEDKPFFSYIVAASSHTPFQLEGLQDRSKISVDVGKYKDTFFGNYLEAVNYADYAFGQFLKGLKEEGLYDDTVILVFGDHNGLPMHNEELEEFLKFYNPELTDLDIELNYTKVACGMKIPGVQNIKIEKPVSKLDIKPTFANLCNLKDGFSLGTDMFASKNFVSLNNEIIIADEYYYNGSWYSRKTGEELDLEHLETEEKAKLDRYYNEMKKELDISLSINLYNLLK